MEFFDVLEKRRSIRKFKDKEIEEEKLQKIFEAANSAPSAGNLQSYEIVVVKNQEKKNALARASLNQKFVAEAPVVLVVCANEDRASPYGKRGKALYCINDADIAASYIQLAATDLGLGTCWVGAFNEDDVRKIINAPNHIRPIVLLPLGYPDETPRKPKRRALNDLIHEEEF